MRWPFAPLELTLALLGLGLLAALVQFGLLTLMFDKLGLDQSAAFTLLLLSLLGSAVNLPLIDVSAQAAPPDAPVRIPRGLLRRPLPEFQGRTLIAVNVGGALIPLLFSIYLYRHHPLAAGTTLLAVAMVTGVSYALSRPVPGIGIGMPMLVAPLAAALVATTLDIEHSAPLAYICGTLGVLIGADLLRLKDIRRMGVPFASIGGAGTFDGVFLTGVVAVLLAG